MSDLRQATMRMMQGDGVGVFIGADGKVHTSEGFFKSIGRLVKALAQLPKLMVMLIKDAVPMAIRLMVEILKVLPKFIKAFIHYFSYIAKDPMRFVMGMLKLFLGTLLLLLLIVSKHVLAYVAVLLTALGAVLPEWCLWNLITLLFLMWSILLSMCDRVSGGVVRFLARAEDHPEAWWRTPSFEEGNGHVRVIGTYKPCAPGYVPGALGSMCRKLSRECVAGACPLASLMRRARTGYFRSPAAIASGQRVVPVKGPACRGRVSAHRAKCAATLTSGRGRINEHALHAPTMSGLARCLCLCRLHAMTGEGLVKRDLAAEVIQGDPLAGRILGSVTPVYGRAGHEFSYTTTLVGAAVIVAIAWTAARSSETMLSLARQTQ